MRSLNNASQCFTSTIFFLPPQGPIWDVWGDRSSNGEKVKYQESIARLRNCSAITILISPFGSVMIMMHHMAQMYVELLML